MTASELGAWCRLKFTEELEPGTFILLFGDLGVGKTFFVQTVIDIMGGEKAFSPTYSLINYYRTKAFKDVYHVDLYRLRDDEDVESTGFWDIFCNEKGLVFIEWADRLKLSQLPLDWKKIQVHIRQGKNGESRNYRFVYTDRV